MATIWFNQARSADGMEIMQDGTLRFSALRAAGLTYLVELDPGNPNHILSIKAKKIRLTLAVPLDQTVRAAYKLPTDPSALPTGPVSADECSDMEPGRIRQMYVQSGTVCKKWHRVNSWPTPQSVKSPDGTETAQMPDGVLRDDTPFLASSAMRKLGDVGRVKGQKSVFLKGLCLSYSPGDLVQSIGPRNVRRVVDQVILHCGEGTQITELVLS